MKIKICGIRRESEIAAFNDALPDYAGFVFAESRRRIAPALARKIRSRLDSRIITVGVFVNAAIDEIIALFADGAIAAAQMHGGESPEFLAELRAARPDLTQIKALPMTADARENQRLANLYAASAADYLLCDNARAGSGETFTWRLLPKMTKPFWLAGGIAPENIADTARIFPPPSGLDLSSGVETDGDQDRAKIIAAVNAARVI